MPDQRAMNATGMGWAGLSERWHAHVGACRRCGAAPSEALSAEELCPGGAELREQLAAARAAYEAAATRGSGWRY